MNNKVRQVRHQKRMALQELAVKARIGPSSLTMIERYGYSPGANVRQKIAKALNTPESELFPEK